MNCPKGVVEDVVVQYVWIKRGLTGGRFSTVQRGIVKRGSRMCCIVVAVAIAQADTNAQTEDSCDQISQ